MAETIYVRPEADKEEKYKELMPQLAALVGSETDEVANMANLSAALKQAFGFFWVGFYRVVGEELVLGPFQCPGHIAGSSESKSEIVVPVVREGQIVGVLDIDSDCLRTFDAIDASRLEEIVRLLS